MEVQHFTDVVCCCIIRQHLSRVVLPSEKVLQRRVKGNLYSTDLQHGSMSQQAQQQMLPISCSYMPTA